MSDATDGHDHDGGDDGHDGHDHHAHDIDTLGFSVVTFSSSRTLESDISGDLIVAACESAGHEVVHRELIPDDFDRVQGILSRLANRDDTDAVVTTGGTGVSPDDVTIEAIRPLFSKQLPGFGELFRTLSRDDIGTQVIATRATAGIIEETPVFCLPGSENAARTGIEELVLPEVSHIAGLARSDDEEETDENEADEEADESDAEDRSETDDEMEADAPSDERADTENEREPS